MGVKSLGNLVFTFELVCELHFLASCTLFTFLFEYAYAIYEWLHKWKVIPEHSDCLCLLIVWFQEDIGRKLLMSAKENLIQ